jgi:uncharacterized low-complexity protein
MKKINKTPLAAAMGTAVVSTFAANAVNAEAKPFGMSELSNGYMQLAEYKPYAGAKSSGSAKTEKTCGAGMGKKEGACGEGKCGNKMKDGAAKMEEGKCAGAKKTAAEGKCGEGKCGDMMDGDKMKKGMEKSCGAMMKGKEGKCGMDKAAGKAKEGKCGEGKCGDMMEQKMKKGMKNLVAL